MATRTSHRLKGKVRDAYLERIMEFPLTSIRSDDDLAAAQDAMDRLLAGGTLAAGDELYLDALSDLVSAYEDEHLQFDPATDAEMLRHLMEAKGVTQTELHQKTGVAKSTISEILAGKKTLSRNLIRTLSEFFDVDKSILAANL